MGDETDDDNPMSFDRCMAEARRLLTIVGLFCAFLMVCFFLGYQSR